MVKLYHQRRNTYLSKSVKRRKFETISENWGLTGVKRTPERNFLSSGLEGTRKPGGTNMRVTKSLAISTKNNKKMTDWITPKLRISGVKREEGMCVTVGVADHRIDQDLLVQHMTDVLRVVF